MKFSRNYTIRVSKKEAFCNNEITEFVSGTDNECGLRRVEEIIKYLTTETLDKFSKKNGTECGYRIKEWYKDMHWVISFVDKDGVIKREYTIWLELIVFNVNLVQILD